MDNNVPVVTIDRNGHIFEFIVTTDQYNETHIDCIIDRNVEDPIRASLDVALPTETRPEICRIARIRLLTLIVNGEEKKINAIRLTDEEYTALDTAKKAREAAVSADIIARTISGDSQYVFSVNQHWGNAEITVWKKYPDGDYLQTTLVTPYELAEIKFREIENGKIENVSPKLQHSGCGYDFMHIITPEERETLIRINAERRDARKVAEQKAREEYEHEKAELLSKVDSWNVAEEKITDEGGKTTMYIHTFVIGDREYTFTERNVFDFGRVINPRYGEKGFAIYYGDTHYWSRSDGEYPMTNDEIICVQIINKYGNFANSRIRM